MGRQHQRKPTLTEKDRHILRRLVSKNRNIAAKVIAEVNIHLEVPVSIKTVLRELLKSNIHGGAAIVKHVITESNAQMCMMISRP
jgi:hypothetical protein